MAHRVLDLGRHVHGRRLGIFNIRDGENAAVELHLEDRGHQRLGAQRLGNDETVEDRGSVFLTDVGHESERRNDTNNLLNAEPYSVQIIFNIIIFFFFQPFVHIIRYL